MLADQTLPKGTAVYEGTSDTVGDVRLDALESGYGIPVSHLISVASSSWTLHGGSEQHRLADQREATSRMIRSEPRARGSPTA